VSRRARDFALACGLFLCSGALGLGYELVWIRKAALVVGASQLAMSTVLTSFFLGLGFGSAFVGRRLRSGKRSPLATYGLFELGIGVWALAFPELFELLETVYGATYPYAAGSQTALFALRFVLLFALCLPPTFLMGGTLPLVLDGLVGEDRAVGSRTSLLYGLNILGAVAGVLVTCYFAIPTLGMNGTSRVGGLGNLLLGSLALLLFRRSAPLHDPSQPLERPRSAFVALAFFTGTIAIAWQIAQARFFSLLDVTTIYTTAMLLAVYLLALSAGSLLLAPWLERRAAPLRLFAAAQMLVPLVGLFSFHACRLVDFSSALGAVRAQDGSIVPLDTMQVHPASALISETVDFVFCAPFLQIGAVVFLPVLFLGVCLPALIAAATTRSSSLRSVSGSLVFWNTLGSSAGAFLGGYFLIPTLGLHGTLTALGVASLTLGAAAWWAAPVSRRMRVAGASLLAPGLAAVVGFGAWSPDLTRYAIERYGVGRHVDESSWQIRVQQPFRLGEIEEGPIETCYIFENEREIRLASGGVFFATVAKVGVPGQALQGHLPVLFHPGAGTPRRCLGICMGSGQSFGAMLMYPIEHLDVVDISPGLVAFSLRHFDAYNHDLARDERVSIHFDDGRHFVQRAPESHYDVIAMEPPPPRADGVFALYSLDFYREVRRALTEDGVFMQWLPLYRVTPRDARGIVNTLARVFPETFVVKHAEQDFMILSYKRRPVFDVAAMRLRCQTFGRERLLASARWGPQCTFEIASFEGLLSILQIGPRALSDLDGADVYRDDTQRLCYGSGDRWLLHRYHGKHLSRLSLAALPESPMAEFAEYFRPPLDATQIAAAEVERAASLYFFSRADPRLLRLLEERRAGSGPPLERFEAILGLALAHDDRLDKERAFDLIEEALALDRGSSAAQHAQVVRRIVRNHLAVHWEATRERLERLDSRFRGAPLVRVMRSAFEEAGGIEVERRGRYLFPDH